MISDPAPDTHYSLEVVTEICERISLGQTLIKICRDRAMPGRNHVNEWLLDPAYPEFHAMYGRAREAQGDYFADEVIDLSNEATKETAQAIRVKIDARKWACSMLNPAKYGDRQTLKLEPGSMKDPESMTDEELVGIIEGNQRRRQVRGDGGGA